ncbi:stage IV sporulation protein B [Amphibacillus marinus]|uniref:Stage IV sporulation protein B n=1 Tax=Amphibacillus marinus TaxID=872970 RepID=A0A1H8NKM8_9BACI|nr:SpoIVB peptidase [Amphibacillus marinus]SEO30059.1 stage IV sporulation protein B [Amphibacillus marinus]
MKNPPVKYICGLIILLAMACIPFVPMVKEYLAIPNEIQLYKNQVESVYTSHFNHGEIEANSTQSIIKIENDQIWPINIGETSLYYTYNGFPIKKVNVNVNDVYEVIPGGQSIGVNLDTLGVLVVGYHQVGSKEQLRSPGQEAGVEIGDTILTLGGKDINAIQDIAPIVKVAGESNKPLSVTYKRGTRVFDEEILPEYDDKTEGYRMGLYIRDSAAGIGTMTFYDPKTEKYGALGHVISDMDTREPIEIESGTIVKSTITSIEKGNSGKPGEKKATFNRQEGEIGTITKNSAYGVFGKLQFDLINELYKTPIAISKPEEVKEGPAQILTVINNEQVEAFDVEIINSVKQKNPATKGMVVKVTDKRLLEETGGIVQGMSGSPIIQNNKLIGAVTHVFVNDPTSGYGIHIEWMLDEAEINHTNTMVEAS